MVSGEWFCVPGLCMADAYTLYSIACALCMSARSRVQVKAALKALCVIDTLHTQLGVGPMAHAYILDNITCAWVHGEMS